MRQVEITRGPSTDAGTFGRLSIPSLARSWLSLECPWRNNLQRRSCIPPGAYRATLAPSSKWSPRGDGRLYGLLEVPDRSLIKIHAANWAGDEELGWYTDLLGCIAPGLQAGSMKPPEFPRE
ncbi:MAG: DUF5675 family protein, partial [Burkholderiales bacterium]